MALSGWRFRFGDFYESIDFVAINHTLRHLKKVEFKEIPRFSFINLYGMDNASHFSLPDAERVQGLYLHYDRFIGELKKILIF